MANDGTLLETELKDCESRIQLIKTNLDAMDKEISLYRILEEKLLENIKCLKTNKIVALAKEFRKSKEELFTARAKLEMLENDRNHFLKIYKDLALSIKKMKDTLSAPEKKKENNVLQFKGRTNGQK